MISELQNISSSLCFIPWRNSGSKKGAMDDKSVQCGMIFPRNLMQVCAHKWASNLAPYIDSQIRQLRKQRLRGEAWVTCEVTYNRVKQKKTKRMMDEEGMIFSSVCRKIQMNKIFLKIFGGLLRLSARAWMEGGRILLAKTNKRFSGIPTTTPGNAISFGADYWNNPRRFLFFSSLWNSALKITNFREKVGPDIIGPKSFKNFIS